MVERLRSRYADAVSEGRLEVRTETFELSATSLKGRYDQIWSADAWHWVDPSIAYHAAADLLTPDGRLVATWTFGVIDDVALAARLNDVYARLSPDLCRDPRSPLEGAPLREGRDEITEFVNPFETPGATNHLVGITSSVGLLIHAGQGRAGGSGAFRTNRSGWAA